MASILKVNTIQGASAAGSIAVTGEGNSTTTNLQQGLAKCWFTDETLHASSNFVEDSFNLSGTQDVSTGQLEVSFTNIFNNDGYSALGVNHASVNDVVGTKALSNSTSSTRYLNYEPANEIYKDSAIGGALLGDLA